MSIISTLEQEEPILVTAKELRRIVAIENDRDYYEFLKDANNILIETAKYGRLADEFSMPPMLMNGDGGLKENLIPMMFLMNQTNGEDKGASAFDMSNPLLLMALMQDKGGSESNDFFTMMILGQMMKSK